MIKQRPFKLNSKSHFLLCCQAIFASSRCFFLCFCLNRNSYIIHCPPGVIIIIIKGTCLPLPDEKSSNPPTTHDGVSDSPSRRGSDHLSRSGGDSGPSQQENSSLKDRWLNLEKGFFFFILCWRLSQTISFLVDIFDLVVVQTSQPLS